MYNQAKIDQRIELENNQVIILEAEAWTTKLLTDGLEFQQQK